MGYDFDRVIDRRNTNSAKWTVGPDELPMWVADMDFAAAPAVLEAVKSRAEHGVWGYAELPEAWYDAYIGWWRDRHGLALERDWLLFCTGIVPAIGSIVRRFTAPGEKVVIQSPVYNCFFSSVTDNGRQVLDSPLRYDGGTYTIDFADLEAKLSDPAATLMLLCNPQNPTGQIWDRQTLARIGELCTKHHVLVVADEIHCDVTEPGTGYVPFASVSETCRDNSVTCLAPTKAFNLAGLKTAAVAAPDPVIREKLARALHSDGVSDAGVFAIDGAVAAFTKGGPWLDELCSYISENKKAASAYLAEELPQVKAVPGQATYLMWLDCTALPGDKEELAQFIRDRTGLFLCGGGMYGDSGFLRMNVGCPRSLLEDGLARLRDGVRLWERERG